MFIAKRSYSIMIVCRYQFIIDGLTENLKNEACIAAIYTATSIKDISPILMNNPIDCIILDIHFLLLNGKETLKRIKQFRPDIRNIIMSRITDAPILASLVMEANAVVAKDTGKDELLIALEKVMAHKKYASPELDLLSHRFCSGITPNTNLITQREKSILQLLKEGKPGEQIAEVLSLSSSRLDTHLRNIVAKLDLKNINALVRYAGKTAAYV